MKNLRKKVGSSGGRYCNGVHNTPSLFMQVMQLLLNAVESNVPEVHLGKGLYMPSLKVFMDDTTLVMNRRPAVWNTPDTFNSLEGGAEQLLKLQYLWSLALIKGKICNNVSFVGAGQQVPTVSEEPIKSLGHVLMIPSPIKTKKVTQLGKMLRGCR